MTRRTTARRSRARPHPRSAGDEEDGGGDMPPSVLTSSANGAATSAKSAVKKGPNAANRVRHAAGPPAVQPRQPSQPSAAEYPPPPPAGTLVEIDRDPSRAQLGAGTPSSLATSVRSGARPRSPRLATSTVRARRAAGPADALRGPSAAAAHRALLLECVSPNACLQSVSASACPQARVRKRVSASVSASACPQARVRKRVSRRVPTESSSRVPPRAPRPPRLRGGPSRAALLSPRALLSLAVVSRGRRRQAALHGLEKEVGRVGAARLRARAHRRRRLHARGHCGGSRRLTPSRYAPLPHLLPPLPPLSPLTPLTPPPARPSGERTSGRGRRRLRAGAFEEDRSRTEVDKDRAARRPPREADGARRRASVRRRERPPSSAAPAGTRNAPPRRPFTGTPTSGPAPAAARKAMRPSPAPRATWRSSCEAASR